VIGARHVLAGVALLLAALAFRATEYYTTRYQTLPALDWLESRPPLEEARAVPLAADLVRGLLRTMPLLVVRDDVRPLLPVLGPPAVVQRTIGGVRDAARIELGAPGAFQPADVPIRARLDVIVFNRAHRAAAWSELMASEFDARDPQTGAGQVRVVGSDAPGGMWLIAPRSGGGVATVAGARGPVGYELQVYYRRPDPLNEEDQLDLSARAEVTARQAAMAWTDWLQAELATAGVAVR
jgi:hypothetical protein